MHYDHYDPQVEGFFGAGYSYEPMERAHLEAEDRYLEQIHEGSLFTPGHFALGDLENYDAYSQYH